ncbi:SPOR domain-containing protein [Microbacterium sp. NIBRBAC000506063]|uniref:SPOR domain-containing protein n=1 Tax=Microbacterium sp. NIBRBAC000506063 TaxID=2734618 RepID=UPI001BB77E6E|nr:SPOR domain-containing protein [Microbacterium sp. NIBRBAC000506063]QTV79719.1 SPOR domain-containing protein [Microbacterium sp. NIBRBAC000506063]
MSNGEEKYWYNLATGEVERGFESPAIDRAGPFDSAEEAARAPEILRERSKAWAEEEAAEDQWGSAAGAADDGE